MLLPRGMFGRDIERGEVVEILLDMGTFGDRETHLAKDRNDLVNRLADRMDMTGAGEGHRQGDIGAFAGEPLLKRRAAQPTGRLRYGRGYRLLGCVQSGPGLTPGLWVQPREPL